MANSGFSINGGSQNNYYCDKFVRVGRGGFNFEEGLEKNPLFQFGTTNLETVTITPWYSDFTIGTKGRANKADVMFPEFATSFFKKCVLSQCSRGSREETAIIYVPTPQNALTDALSAEIPPFV